jgi:hypothetical protein
LNEDVIAYNPKADKSQKLPQKPKEENRPPDPMEAILQLSKTLTTEK